MMSRGRAEGRRGRGREYARRESLCAREGAAAREAGRERGRDCAASPMMETKHAFDTPRKAGHLETSLRLVVRVSRVERLGGSSSKRTCHNRARVSRGRGRWRGA